MKLNIHYYRPCTICGSRNDLTKKYYQIKNFSSKLKGNWYDIANYNTTLFKHLHAEDILKFMKNFLIHVIFSAIMYSRT